MWRVGLLVAFHPAARGRAMVDKYRAAAERSGYIVAGSNNVSAAAARASELSKPQDVKRALARDRADDDAEARLLDLGGVRRLAYG